MKFLATSATIIAAVAISASAESTQPCCHVCSDPNTPKYYSIDTTFNKCGETCLQDKYYGLYHIFEKGLKKATSNTMCADLGYTVYDSTVTHGFGPIKSTLDLYNPTPQAGDNVKHIPEETTIMAPEATVEAQPCCHVCSDPNTPKYYSIDTTFNKCGETCLQDKYYGLYHIFEKGLKKATSNTMCADLGYTVYDSTVTHGFGPIKSTLDLYNPDPKGMEVSEKVVLAASDAAETPVESEKEGAATSPFIYIVPSFLGGVALAAAAFVFGRKSAEKKDSVESGYLLA